MSWKLLTENETTDQGQIRNSFAMNRDQTRLAMQEKNRKRVQSSKQMAQRKLVVCWPRTVWLKLQSFFSNFKQSGLSATGKLISVFQLE